MNKILMVAPLIFITGRIGFAVPGFELLQKQVQDRVVSSPHRVQRANDCVNFSGNWKGKCSVGEVSQEGTIEIQQDGCESIRLGTETIMLGGLDGRFQNNPTKDGISYSISVSMTNDWNADRTELKTYFTGIVKVAGTEGFTPLTGTGVMRLNGAKLVNDLDVFGFKVNCVYEKQ